MNVEAKGLDYKALNEAIRAAGPSCRITGCLGQRFIGAGMSGRQVEIDGIPGNALGAATNYIVTDGSLYKIGPRTFELGLSYASSQNALSIIRSEMRGIVSKVDEVCQMGVLAGQDVHYLLKEEGHAIISIISEVGHHLPAHVTGLGKALLSGMTDEAVKQLYQGYRFYPYTAHSIMDLDSLIANLHEIRSSGIAYENEESTAEICCAAVPLAEDGQVKAAISVTIPKFRYTD